VGVWASIVNYSLPTTQRRRTRTRGNLRRSAIPEEDLQLLRGAGVQHPEAEVTITISYSREYLGRAYPNIHPSQTVEHAVETLREAASQLQPSGFVRSGHRPGAYRASVVSMAELGVGQSICAMALTRTSTGEPTGGS